MARADHGGASRVNDGEPSLTWDRDLWALLDGASDGWVLTSVVRDAGGRAHDFRVEYMNAVGLAAVQLERDAAIGRTYRELFPSTVADGLLDAYLHTYATGTPVRRTVWYDDRRVSGYYDLEVRRFGAGFAMRFANTTGLVLDRARLEADRRRAPSRPAADPRLLGLHRVAVALSAAATVDDVADTVVGRVVPALDADAVVLAVPRAGDELTVLVADGPGADELADLSPGRPLAHVAATVAPYAAAADRHGRSWVVLPLVVAGRLVGVWAVRPTGAVADDEDAVDGDVVDDGGPAQLRAVAGMLAETLDRARLYQRERDLRAEVEREQAFQTAILDSLAEAVIGCDASGRLVTFNRRARQWHAAGPTAEATTRWAERYGLRRLDGTMLAPAEIPLVRALHGEVVRNAEILISAPGHEPRTVLVNAQPATDHAGTRVGAVAALHDVTDRKQAEAELQRRALHDPLTGLPNRVLLFDRLDQALTRRERDGTTLAVLFVDLDRFKAVNDTLGHDVGDRVLLRTAERLRGTVRAVDTVARLGGDEFVVVCEGLAVPEEAVGLGGRVEAALAEPVPLEDGTAGTTVVTASVGIAVAGPDDRPADLVRKSDSAMYEAKQHGRGQHRLFDERVARRASERLASEAEVRRALDEERLVLWYQPVVDLGSGTVTGAEALLRYRDADGALVTPDRFLGVAEETGLIVPMGAWVIDEACRQRARWRDETGVDIDLAVNLSARQLASAGVAERLERWRDGGEVLDVEITESVLVEATESTLRNLRRLKRTGARLGLDDFGTGWSSLTYLRRFPVDFLKVDRSFVSGLGHDEEDSVIVTAVVQLADALGLGCVAEGVETAEQAGQVTQLGCARAQGFHFGRPGPPEQLSELLAA